jgi:hypothetical protein
MSRKKFPIPLREKSAGDGRPSHEKKDGRHRRGGVDVPYWCVTSKLINWVSIQTASTY